MLAKIIIIIIIITRKPLPFSLLFIVNALGLEKSNQCLHNLTTSKALLLSTRLEITKLLVALYLNLDELTLLPSAFYSTTILLVVV